MNIKSLYNLYSKHFLIDTDSRKIRSKAIFFALKGEQFNGNKFAEEAINLGASYAVIDEKPYKTLPNIILVDDVLKTLQKLANFHRKTLDIPIIGITGSNGKTTTKELISAVLSKKHRTTATFGNYNNHIGVPLTLLSMTNLTQIGIVEMGANNQKEIQFLCSICEPDYGYITNFGKAHLEGFGSIKGVIKGKSELYDFLKENNKTAFINPNDTLQTCKTRNINCIPFDYSLKFIEATPFVKLSFKSNFIHSNLIGEYNYSNIAVACTIGNYFKVSFKDIKKAIESYVPNNNRSQIIEKKENRIILDAYNANPTSMRVAIQSFSSMKGNSKAVILGDMFEIGESSLQEHKEIIDLVSSMNFRRSFFIGKNFFQATSSNNTFKTLEDFKNYLEKFPLKGQLILIKGSRGMCLEKLMKVID